MQVGQINRIVSQKPKIDHDEEARRKDIAWKILNSEQEQKQPDTEKIHKDVRIKGMSAIDSHYAGFWKRSFAFLIDFAIAYPLALFLFESYEAINISVLRPNGVNFFQLDASIMALSEDFLGVLIFALLLMIQECSRLNSTIGKRLIGYEVLDCYNDSLSLFRSFFRNLLKVAPILFVLYLDTRDPVIFFTHIGICVLCYLISIWSTIYSKKKQCLHGYLTGTFVVLPIESR